MVQNPFRQNIFVVRVFWGKKKKPTRNETEVEFIPTASITVFFKMQEKLSRSARVGYIVIHLLPPVGSLGFWDFSTSVIICSNALVTLVLSRALASVKAHLNSSARSRPSLMGTCLRSALRSLLLPTMTMGTQSAP